MKYRTIKLVIHLDKGKYVVNAPGSGLNPHVYGSLGRALDKMDELASTPR